jgi:hypothetical protein
MTGKAVGFLTDQLGELDPEVVEYCVSIAQDSSMEDPEKSEFLVEYLYSINESADCPRIASEFVRLHRLDSTAVKADVSQITAEAVAACLDVIRAPEIKSPREANTIDPEVRKKLLKLYDDDATIAKAESQEQEEEDEILGLGRNENRLRVAREREEERARAKQEHEEARAERVAQKLKSQGESLKSRTVSRRK